MKSTGGDVECRAVERANLPLFWSAATGEWAESGWWGCPPSDGLSDADVPSQGTPRSHPTSWNRSAGMIARELKIPSWMSASHTPMVPLSHDAANSSKFRANVIRQTWANHQLANAPANILHNVHYAGSQNQLIKCLWFVPLNLHCLDVQLHIGGQVDVCHAELCQRFHHIHHRRKDRVRTSRWCINQWPEQIHRWSSLGTSSRLQSELAIEATPFHWRIECGRREQGVQPLRSRRDATQLLFKKPVVE